MNANTRELSVNSSSEFSDEVVDPDDGSPSRWPCLSGVAMKFVIGEEVSSDDEKEASSRDDTARTTSEAATGFLKELYR